MPALQTVLANLNAAFGRENIEELAKSREQFAQGTKLSAALQLVLARDKALYKYLVPYIDGLPQSLHEMLRAAIYGALSGKTPVQITFAWAPGYDYELTVWQAPDTKATKGGVTILLKSRYPNDEHPLAQQPARKAKEA